MSKLLRIRIGNWEEACQFVASLSSLQDWSVADCGLDSLEIFASKQTPTAETILTVSIEMLLRSNIYLTSLAGQKLRDWMERHLIGVDAGLEILERWERFPVVGFQPNLGAGVYEHLVGNIELRAGFSRWMNDKALRRLFIESAHCLPEEDELKTYEQALNMGEKEAVRKSLSNFASVRKTPLGKRWEKILREIRN